MRKKIVIGNWKMNTTIEQAINLLVDIKENLDDVSTTIVCVPYTHIAVAQEIVDDRIAIGAQNVSQFEKGAYTGEIAANMLQSLGVEFAIVGHSERRNIFNESNEVVNQKLHHCFQNDILPILCLGESLAIRKNKQHLSFIKEQLTACLSNVNEEQIEDVIIAYEPIWAIGTGETASVEQAQEAHEFIRSEIANMFNATIANQMTILYGGSVKPTNAKALFQASDIDGALVGGASLNAADFVAIIKSI